MKTLSENISTCSSATPSAVMESKRSAIISGRITGT